MPSRVVHISEKGMRLDRFMRIHFSDVPFGTIGGLLKRGKLTVDGGPADAAQPLAEGQVIAIAHRDKLTARSTVISGPGASLAQATPKQLNATDLAFLKGIKLYEDDDIIVFDKPSGLAVHPGSKITRDLDSMLVRMVQHGAERPVLAHRLDKDTSGLIVAAKRKDVASALGKAFAARDVEKEYQAIVAGVPDEGLIDIAIKKMATPKGGRMVAAEAGDKEGLAAQTRVAVLSINADRTRTLVALYPETGRQHQLRLHLALVGHPILGDALYGDPAGAPRLMLHARTLSFRHPRGGPIDLEAPMPAEFDALMS